MGVLALSYYKLVHVRMVLPHCESKKQSSQHFFAKVMPKIRVTTFFD